MSNKNKLPSSGWITDLGFSATKHTVVRSKKFYTRKGRHGKNYRGE